MKFKYLLMFKVLGLLFIFHPIAKAACGIPAKLDYQRLSSGTLWTRLNLSTEWENNKIPDLEPLIQFQNHVNSLTDTDPIYLLKKQEEIYKSLPEEQKVIRAVIDGKIGSISKIGCLEASLFAAHLAATGGVNTEFLAFVLTQNKSHQKLTRIYIVSSNNKMSVPSSSLIDQMIEKDLKNNWKVFVDLHNHPFSFDNPYGDISGTVVPSSTDFSSYRKLNKKWGLEQAWITNGFHTGKYQPPDFNYKPTSSLLSSSSPSHLQEKSLSRHLFSASTEPLLRPLLDTHLPVAPPLEFALWNFHNYGQTFRIDPEHLGHKGKVGADINLLKAWSIIDSSPDVLVAVIDGGFNFEQEDLKDVYDITQAYSFLNHSSHFNLSSLDAHGDAVSGIIGANGYNTIGITGVSRKVKILPLEALPEFPLHEKDQDIAQAIYYAIEKGARIINCSFGKYTTSNTITKAIQYAHEKNVLIVASAGNEGQNIDIHPHWPSHYSTHFDNVISVGATNRRDELWNHSNYGMSVDVTAPGHEILTIGKVGSRFPYHSLSGNSMSTPHVSGLAALMIQLKPSLTPQEIKQIIIKSADIIPNLKGKIKSSGRINAYRALLMTQSYH